MQPVQPPGEGVYYILSGMELKKHLSQHYLTPLKLYLTPVQWPRLRLTRLQRCCKRYCWV